MCDLCILCHKRLPASVFFSLAYINKKTWMKHSVICLAYLTRQHSDEAPSKWQEIKECLKKRTPLWLNTVMFLCFASFSLGGRGFWVCLWVASSLPEKRNAARGSKLWFLKIYHALQWKRTGSFSKLFLLLIHFEDKLMLKTDFRMQLK